MVKKMDIKELMKVEKVRVFLEEFLKKMELCYECRKSTPMWGICEKCGYNNQPHHDDLTKGYIRKMSEITGFSTMECFNIMIKVIENADDKN